MDRGEFVPAPELHLSTWTTRHVGAIRRAFGLRPSAMDVLQNLLSRTGKDGRVFASNGRIAADLAADVRVVRLGLQQLRSAIFDGQPLLETMWSGERSTRKTFPGLEALHLAQVAVEDWQGEAFAGRVARCRRRGDQSILLSEAGSDDPPKVGEDQTIREGRIKRSGGGGSVHPPKVEGKVEGKGEHTRVRLSAGRISDFCYCTDWLRVLLYLDDDEEFAGDCFCEGVHPNQGFRVWEILAANEPAEEARRLAGICDQDLCSPPYPLISAVATANMDPELGGRWLCEAALQLKPDPQKANLSGWSSAGDFSAVNSLMVQFEHVAQQHAEGHS
jgi:hypothetical protein